MPALRGLAFEVDLPQRVATQGGRLIARGCPGFALQVYPAVDQVCAAHTSGAPQRPIRQTRVRPRTQAEIAAAHVLPSQDVTDENGEIGLAEIRIT
ncbi:hypothetical protein GCM10010199_69310 [Dactylosporangium roseum]